MKYLLCLIVISGFLFSSCENNNMYSASHGLNKKYQVTVTVTPKGAGSISRSSEGPYPAFGTVVLTAEPNKNFAFVKWTGDFASAETAIQILTDQDHSLTAVFRKSIRVHSFKLASNGITVTCNEANFGTYDIVNGEKYTKRKASAITTSNAANTCTSGITDMSGLFKGETNFNGDISSWDVSNVTDMSDMFYEDHAFNQDISNWDVSNVTSLSHTFYKDYAFNQDIGSWDISNVTSLYKTFAYAKSFNQYIGNWDVSNVTTMHKTFEHAHAFNQALGKWDVSNVTSMYEMFKDATSFNQDIGDWDVSNVITMHKMFEHAHSFDQDLSGWCVKNVTKHEEFAKDSPLANEPAKLPKWGTCPEL